MFRTLLAGPDGEAFLALLAEFARFECHGAQAQGPGARGDGHREGLAALPDAVAEIVQDACRRGLALPPGATPEDLLRGPGRGWLRLFVRNVAQSRARRARRYRARVQAWALHARPGRPAARLTPSEEQLHDLPSAERAAYLALQRADSEAAAALLLGISTTELVRRVHWAVTRHRLEVPGILERFGQEPGSLARLPWAARAPCARILFDLGWTWEQLGVEYGVPADRLRSQMRRDAGFQPH